MIRGALLYAAVVAVQYAAGETEVEKVPADHRVTSPEQSLADMLCSAAIGESVSIPTDISKSPIAYVGLKLAGSEFDPLFEVDVTKLVGSFADKMRTAAAGVTQNGFLETADGPVTVDEATAAAREDDDAAEEKETEGVDGSTKITEGAKKRYRPRICQKDIFYPYDSCVVAETRKVQSAQACAKYCQTIATQTETTYMSFGGRYGEYKGICLCYRHKPYSRPVKLHDCGAASYPLTLQGYYIAEDTCHYQFSAPSEEQCQRGCLLNAWYSGRKNALYSFEGCYLSGVRGEPEQPDCPTFEHGPDPHSHILPPVLKSNCKCFYEPAKFAIGYSTYAAMGPAAACEFTIAGESCYKCKLNGWKYDYCKNCRDYPY